MKIRIEYTEHELIQFLFGYTLDEIQQMVIARAFDKHHMAIVRKHLVVRAEIEAHKKSNDK